MSDERIPQRGSETADNPEAIARLKADRRARMSPEDRQAEVEWLRRMEAFDTAAAALRELIAEHGLNLEVIATVCQPSYAADLKAGLTMLEDARFRAAQRNSYTRIRRLPSRPGRRRLELRVESLARAQRRAWADFMEHVARTDPRGADHYATSRRRGALAKAALARWDADWSPPTPPPEQLGLPPRRLRALREAAAEFDLPERLVAPKSRRHMQPTASATRAIELDDDAKTRAFAELQRKRGEG